MEAKEAFKVIIIGAGPVGFFAAHCFLKANIDFVILEAHQEIAKEIGAGIALGPPQMRAFGQLGILPQVLEISSELLMKKSYLEDGYKFLEMDFFKFTRANFGTGANIVHRARFLKMFYDTLPNDAKAKVLTGKKVTDIQSDEQGVTVTCSDNSVFQGHLVLGADGTHSVTRRIMRNHALSEDPKRDWDPEQPFQSSYKVTWGTATQFEKTHIGNFTEVQAQDRATMAYFGKEQAWVFMYEKLEKPTKERTSYTLEETKAFADTFSDWVADDGLKIGELLSHVTTQGSSLIPEGDCKNWTHGRIVLAGDAVHTWAPNAGRGLNNGFLDIVSLSNRLNRLINGGSSSSGGLEPSPSPSPTAGELEKTLKEYEADRSVAVTDDSALSQHIVRWQTWANTLYYIAGRYIMSWPSLIEFLMNNFDAQKMRRWIVLDYIKVEKEPFLGRVSWLHSITKNLSSI